MNQVGGQKIDPLAGTTPLFEIVRSLGSDSIEVKSTQFNTYNILNTIYKKIKEGTSLSSIERSLWDRGARDMGGEEKASLIFKTSENTPERRLMEKFYGILNRYSGENTTDFVEVLVGKIISEDAIQKGYDKSDFYDRLFYKIIMKNTKSKSFVRIIEKYEFLFRFSNIFTKNDRSELLKAIKIYLDEKGIVEIDSKEYSLIKTAQKAYFKEHKKFITFRDLVSKIPGFKSKKPFMFGEKMTKSSVNDIYEVSVYQLEFWAKKHLSGKNLEKVQNKIDEWRSDPDHPDTSVYAIQNTPFRKIAYSFLILLSNKYYQINEEAITIKTLDKLLYDRFGKLIGYDFFKNRIYEDRIYHVEDERMNRLILFAKEEFFSSAPKETKVLVKLIQEYIKLPRISNRYLETHSFYQGRIKPYQLKTLTDIIKGLDVVDCVFLSDNDLTTIAKKGGATIHHIYIYEDSTQSFIFEIASGEEGYKIKLAPLKYYESHSKIHNVRRNFKKMASDLVQARMKYLYELSKMSYETKISKEEYFKIFKAKFRNEKVFISKYGKRVNIWESFEDGKINGISDNTIEKFIEKWIDYKKNGELSWYLKYYPKFYVKKYLSFIERLKTYAKDSLISPIETSVYEWFLTYYLPNEIFP